MKRKLFGLVQGAGTKPKDNNQPVAGIGSETPLLPATALECGPIVGGAMQEPVEGTRKQPALQQEYEAVAAKAAEWNLPFFCVRVVTDTAAESFPLDFNRMRDADGRFSRIKILAAALRRPGSVLPGLVKLNKRCKDASQALGDFIVNASF